MIAVSAGDFYGGADVFNEPKSHFVARMMAHLEYDAIGVGEMDLNYGLAKLREDVESLGLKVTCANLMSKGTSGNETVFPPYIVVERGGVRFGFMGLLSPTTKTRLGGTSDLKVAEEVAAMTYIIKNPVMVASEIIPELRRRCDVLVLLAHMDRVELGSFLPDYPQVDFVVLGHNAITMALNPPVSLGSAQVVMATSQGQNIGNLSIFLGDNHQVARVENRVIFLDSSIKDDPDMLARQDRFDQENRKVQKKLYAQAQLEAARSQVEPENIYLGLGACQSCHVEAFEIYTRSAHAQAYQTLSSQFMHRDDNCVGCHVTGYQKHGGFGGLRTIGNPVDLIDVQCEACHGPGSKHARDGSYSARAIESCVKCHTKNEDPDFEFATDWPKIAH